MKKMKKVLHSQSGFTLVEMLVTVAILAILVVAMSTGMNTAMRVYKESIFQSNSASLAGMMNTTLGDMLRYSSDVYEKETVTEADGSTKTVYKLDAQKLVGVVDSGNSDFLFSNMEYGAKHAYIFVDSTNGTVRIKNAVGEQVRDILNTGAYPDLKIEAVVDADGKWITYRDGVFTITYAIVSTENSEYRRSETTVVRLLNQ